MLYFTEEEDDEDDEDEGNTDPLCLDLNPQCVKWADAGECDVNPKYMVSASKVPDIISQGSSNNGTCNDGTVYAQLSYSSEALGCLAI